MKRIELYINRQLCDIGNMKDFSIYFKRQFLNPAELSTKDAQRSYDITLPASPANNAIFGYINTEEVKNKFATLYDAVVIIGSVKVFEGKFKLSEVSAKQYKGNLGIPYTKTIKEIFGDKNMNEVGTWLARFYMIENLSHHDTNEEKENRGFFFPLAMYGLLPKVPLTNGSYSGKLDIDDSVRFGLEDFPPSLNCLQVVKKLFGAKGIKLTGSAFTDDRLSNLYMSYKNPSDYIMPWSYGDMAKMKINGSWSNCHFLPKDSTPNGSRIPKLFEMRGIQTRSSDKNAESYTCNILHSTNLQDENIIEDRGHNIISSTKTIKNYVIADSKDVVDRTEKQYTISIPASGYYRVKLKGDLHVPRYKIPSSNSKPNENWIEVFHRFDKADPNTGLHFMSADRTDGVDEYLNDKRYELKLIRDWGTGDFGLDNTSIDAVFYEKNQPQTLKEINNGLPPEDSYFPPITNTSGSGVNFRPNQTVFVDPAQNPNLVLGLSWGAWEEGRENTSNPLDNKKDKSGTIRSEYPIWAHTLVAKSCYSWDYESRGKNLARIIVNSPVGYKRYSSKEVEEKTFATRDMSSIPAQYLYDTDKYKMGLANSPQNYARRGFYKGIMKPLGGTYYNNQINWFGDGEMNAIVWFEKGERITLVSSSDRGKPSFWIWHTLDFELSIEPYRIDRGWAKIDEYTGNTKEQLDWYAIPPKNFEFPTGNIDLMKFLPSTVKIDDWLNNFCKTFNLELIQKGKDLFELNTKKGLNWNTSLIIDIDNRANVIVNRQNTPLGLPGAYEIGFTIDKDEIGHVNTTIRYEDDGSPVVDEQGVIKVYEGDNGGGRFETGSPENNTLSQTSNFSHNWMIDVTGKGSFYENGSFPIISDKEVWDMSDNRDYAGMMLKSYHDKAQRFWYRSNDTYKAKINNKVEIDAGMVTAANNGNLKMVLNYRNIPDSILRNYFMVLSNADNCYTTVECYISPEEYSYIEYSLARFNGDLYYIAEVDGYDPLGIKKTTLKLIKKNTINS